MRMAAVACCLALALGGMTACKEKSTKIRIKTSVDNCDLTLDGLADTTWVIEKINPDKSTEPDPQTRMRFFKEDGQLKVKYNVGSLSDMYTYACRLNKRGDELVCKEPPKLRDFCQALAVVDESKCTPEALKKLAPEASDADIAKAIEEAMANVRKYKGTKDWDAFVFNNNNLGNKLQGVLYVKVDKRHCKLRVTDNYITIYNGEVKEDSNPVGTNPFVRSDEELFFEHCTDSGDLIATRSEAFPSKPEEAVTCAPNRGCFFKPGETVWYHYIGQDGRTPEEGCTYSYDAWLNWRPLKKDQPASTVKVRGKDELRWSFSHVFQETGLQVMEIVRYKACGGPKEKIEVSCNLVQVKP